MDEAGRGAYRAKDIETAIAIFRDGLIESEARWGSSQDCTVSLANNLAYCLREQSRHAEAATVLRRLFAAEKADRALAEPRTFTRAIWLADSLMEIRELDEAERVLMELFSAVTAEGAGAPAHYPAEVANRMIRVHEAAGRHQAASEWRARLPADAAAESTAK